jgi:hypothetical protein
MKTEVEIADRQQAQDLRRAMNDPQTRAFVLEMGALLRFTDPNRHHRILRHVEDSLISWRRATHRAERDAEAHP